MPWRRSTSARCSSTDRALTGGGCDSSGRTRCPFQSTPEQPGPAPAGRAPESGADHDRDPAVHPHPASTRRRTTGAAGSRPPLAGGPGPGGPRPRTGLGDAHSALPGASGRRAGRPALGAAAPGDRGARARALRRGGRRGGECVVRPPADHRRTAPPGADPPRAPGPGPRPGGRLGAAPSHGSAAAVARPAWHDPPPARRVRCRRSAPRALRPPGRRRVPAGVGRHGRLPARTRGPAVGPAGPARLACAARRPLRAAYRGCAVPRARSRGRLSVRRRHPGDGRVRGLPGLPGVLHRRHRLLPARPRRTAAHRPRGPVLQRPRPAGARHRLPDDRERDLAARDPGDPRADGAAADPDRALRRLLRAGGPDRRARPVRPVGADLVERAARPTGRPPGRRAAPVRSSPRPGLGPAGHPDAGGGLRVGAVAPAGDGDRDGRRRARPGGAAERSVVRRRRAP